MYVACSTLCFAKLPFEDALRVIREMRFAKADLAIHEEGPHLRPSDVLADVGRVAQKLKASNLPVAAISLRFGAFDGPETRQQLHAVCRLARVMAVPLLSVLAAPVGSTLDADVGRLQDWAGIAAAEGLILTIETRSDTLTADPLGTLELCKQVPGLCVALDPSHYHCGPHAGVNYDMLFPLVRHVRLRDSGTKLEDFQVRVGQGELEYGRIITQLARVRYDRAFSVDFQDIADSAFPVEPEVRKLKYLLESLV